MSMYWIELDNGKWMVNDYGKYRPNLTFILNNKEDLENWEQIHGSELNLECGTLYRLTGNFWENKKGTKCFHVRKDGKHQLIRDSWGGAFCSYRGNIILNTGESLYERRASSNGGGIGYDYAVFPVGWKKVEKFEDYQ